MAKIFYDLTERIISISGARFAKTCAHDGDDAEGVDLLWLEYTPEDAFSDGEVIKVGRGSPDGNTWFASQESAYRAGGWPTHWTTAGTDDEVVQQVKALLISENQETE